MKAETYRLSNEGIEDRHADLMAQLMDFKAEIDSRPPLVTPQPSPRFSLWQAFAIGCGVGAAVVVTITFLSAWLN
jgi:hypothetical protein